MVQNLKRLRKQKELSQQKLGDLLGVSQRAINQYENRKTEPSICMLMKMADYFETSLDYLVGYSTVCHNADAVKVYHLNMEESVLVDIYRQLTPRRQERIRLIAENYMFV